MDTQKLDRAIEQLKAQERTGYGVEQFEVGIQAILGVRKAAKKLAYIHQCIDLYCDREELHDESYWLDYILDPEWIDTDIGWDGYEMKPNAQPDYKTDHGYMWLCPECGLAVHSDYTRCVRCGWERRTDEGD